MRTYNLGPVKPWVQANAEHLGHKFNISVIGGYRSTGSVPNSDHPKGLAIDLMCDIPTGERIVAYVRANWTRFNISYVIHNRRIWNGPSNEQRYFGPSPHTDHVHISYKATGTGGGDNPMNVAGPDVLDPLGLDLNPGFDKAAETAEQTLGAVNNIVSLIQFMTDPANWRRIGLAVGGGLAILLGLLAILRGPVLVDLRKVIK